MEVLRTGLACLRKVLKWEEVKGREGEMVKGNGENGGGGYRSGF